MSADQSVEQHIQAAGANVAPRITPDDIQANIVREHYFTAADGVAGAFVNAQIAQGRGVYPDEIGKLLPSLGLLTFCVLGLRNGFTVTGESACASPENFNAEIGRRIARENAVAKIWPLMGYELRTRIAEGRTTIADRSGLGGGHQLSAEARKPYTNSDVVSWESSQFQDVRTFRFSDGATQQVTGDEVREALKTSTHAIGGDIAMHIAVKRQNEATGGKSA